MWHFSLWRMRERSTPHGSRSSFGAFLRFTRQQQFLLQDFGGKAQWRHYWDTSCSRRFLSRRSPLSLPFMPPGQVADRTRSGRCGSTRMHGRSGTAEVEAGRASCPYNLVDVRRARDALSFRQHLLAGIEWRRSQVPPTPWCSLPVCPESRQPSRHGGGCHLPRSA